MDQDGTRIADEMQFGLTENKRKEVNSEEQEKNKIPFQTTLEVCLAPQTYEEEV